jgi:hypothetical protein
VYDASIFGGDVSYVYVYTTPTTKEQFSWICNYVNRILIDIKDKAYTVCYEFFRYFSDNQNLSGSYLKFTKEDLSEFIYFWLMIIM